MQQTIINLKERIDNNKQALYDEYGEKCQLIEPIENIIDLLLSINATDDIIKSYLKNVNNAIQIIEEKLEYVERKKR